VLDVPKMDSNLSTSATLTLKIPSRLLKK